MKLNVFFGRSLVGRIDRTWSFRYDETWLERPDSLGISLSLPLQQEQLPKKTTRNFFANLLPEATLRESIAKAHRIAYDDDFALLELMGAECAGALQIISEKSDPLIGRGFYEEVSIEDLCARLRKRPSVPLAEFAADLRMSLAGAQDKMPVLFQKGAFSLPRDGAPSSHILKPASPRFPDSVVNEAFSMKLARLLGLPVPNFKIIPSDPPLFLIERYDRKFLRDGSVQRIHQEDFCQALGIAHQKKYESDGGPGFAKCADVLGRTEAPGANRLRLARWAIFNLLIGNADAHGKNLSLHYENAAIPSMAPCYDLLSTAIYPELSRKMAMHIGGERLIDRIYRDQWTRFSKDVNLNVRRIFAELENMIAKITERAPEVAGEMECEYGRSEFYANALSVVDRACANAKQALDQP